MLQQIVLTINYNKKFKMRLPNPPQRGTCGSAPTHDQLIVLKRK